MCEPKSADINITIGKYRLSAKRPIIGRYRLSADYRCISSYYISGSHFCLQFLTRTLWICRKVSLPAACYTYKCCKGCKPIILPRVCPWQ